MKNLKYFALTALAVTTVGLVLSSYTPSNAQPDLRRYQNQNYGRNSFRSNIPYNQGYYTNYLPYPAYQRPVAPVWNLSLGGGYYDQTGGIKIVVPGSELFRYGGTFYDGRPVPTGPVGTNAAGHVLF